ncbi:MAG TPA: HlyD family efflux transporter periplasmic adaptor subunit [Thermoanaerobaculia bacterium]|jgi:multidrug efflux pump subunit AcrA (membrane-fusion protein)|nr:HlyD family efflux transporter periplasmic adaptor subunit [Thermoanaerobaculia bacterium]
MRIGSGHLSPARASASVVVVLLALSCAGPAPVPTYEVVPRDFTHRVTAEGFLRSTDVTMVQVPVEAPPGGAILWRADDGIQVKEGEVVALLDRAEMERRVKKEEADLASAQVRRDQTVVEGEARVDEVASRKHEAELELDLAERFRRVDRDLYSRREILQSEIDEQLARVRQDQAGELQKLHRDLAATELVLVDVDRRRAADEVRRARRQLDALEVKAPRAGVLTWVRNDKGDLPQIGEQVWRGQKLAEIPTVSELGIEAFVVEADFGGIVPGCEATVTLDAHPELSYRAQVTRVDPIAQRRLEGSPSLFFEIQLELEKTDLSIMKPGQRVTASILVEEVANALVVPRQALFSEEGAYVVYRVNGSDFERTPVRVSALARGLAVVASGLDAGNRVALAEPGSDSHGGGLRKALAAFMGGG